MPFNHVIGLMSGTSLDGLDIAFCSFLQSGKRWKYKIVKAQTLSYPPSLAKRLKTAHRLSSNALDELDTFYANYLAEKVLQFVPGLAVEPDLISSHGHTVFHQPEKGISLQIGKGEIIAARTGIPTVSDFRTLDIRLGGQGAPLVPAGDEYLFPEFNACLNLGGFSNISYRLSGKRIAFDICPVNIILNHISARLGKAYDHRGSLGRQGQPDPGLLLELDAIEFYRKDPPRSLGREWLLSEMLPLLKKNSLSPADQLATMYEHISGQIAGHLKKGQTILTTGGGACNDFLIEQIRQKSGSRIIIPDEELVEFKEAMVFAFLGLLRVRNEINCFSSVTGASRDCSCGTLHKIS